MMLGKWSWEVSPEQVLPLIGRFIRITETLKVWSDYSYSMSETSENVVSSLVQVMGPSTQMPIVTAL